MEAKVVFLVLVVAASGCAHTGPGTSEGSSQEKSGLVVQSFGITDQQLTPGQSAIVRVRLKNYHTEPIDITKISLYNTGLLQVGKRSCTPSPDPKSSIGQARKGFAPEMKCSWEITAPDELRGFESRAVTMKLNLRYRSSLTNEQEPLKVRFQKLTDITERKEMKKTYSNGEVSATVSLENPVPREGGLVSFSFGSTGPGRVVSDYTMSYRPTSIFSSCPNKKEPVTGKSTRFSCDITSGSSSTRNLVFSTSYKYVKSPSLDVEVARP